FVELAGGENSTVVGGREVMPMTGRSIAPILRGEVDATRGPDDVFALEHGGQRAVYRGDWKALWIPPPNGIGGCQLFDLAKDPGETADLAAEYPEVLAELAAAYERYAEEVGVVPPAPRAGAGPGQGATRNPTQAPASAN